MSKPRVAMLGLGLMGAGMAQQLLAKGFPLTVYNRTPEKAAALGHKGAAVAKSPRDAAANADVIISMLADDAAAKAVWLGDNGALAGAAKGTICIESSTATVDWVKQLASAVAQKGCELLDAPVTGSRTHAAAGELNFIVGGSESALSKARPILEAMSKSITHLGPIGSGALLKLINNFVCAVQAASFAEGLTWCERAGLDLEKALPIMTEGAPGSPLVKAMRTRMTAKDYTPHFYAQLLAKDVTYAMQQAKQCGLDLTTAMPVLELLEKTIAAGHGGKDMSAIIEPLRKAPHPRT